MTYSDGLSNVDINALIAFHNRNKKYATVTAVRPLQGFGAIELENSVVKKLYRNLKQKVDGSMRLFCIITKSNEIYQLLQ